MPSSWDLLQQVFTVETIMTPWSDVTTIRQDDLDGDSSALLIAQEQNYSLLPVVAPDGRVTGIFEPRGTRHHPLTPDWLISHDTPIPDLIELFAQSRKRGFLAMYRQDMVGFVTPADINKMPVRIYLFNLLADLETALASAIHAHFRGDDQAVLELLGPHDLAGNVVEFSPSMRGEELDLGVLQRLFFRGLIKILHKTPPLYQAIGFSSESHVDVLHGLADLRNNVAHSVHPLLTSHRDMPHLFEQIQLAQEILDWLARDAESRGDMDLPLHRSSSRKPFDEN